MSDTSTKPRSSIFVQAFAYSIPVLLGYLAIGTAFGLLISDAGYPIWLALFMSLWMFAGAGQYIAVGLFVTGTTLWEACLIQLVVNARHIAYGLSMLNRFPKKSPFKPYLIFSLTDETFALLSSLPPGTHERFPPPGKERDRFMFYVSILDQSYWVAGSLIGAAAGSLIPFDMEGISFALTALFIVLMIEQIFRIKKPGVFVISALAALLAVFLFPERITLLAGMVMALLFSFLFELYHGQYTKGKEP
jgi:4-azaleucine resistance transporter AzlC